MTANMCGLLSADWRPRLRFGRLREFISIAGQIKTLKGY
jgi:hypothetical protein